MDRTKTWKTCRAAGMECPGCEEKSSCTVSPDGTAFKCWRDGGRVIQTEPSKRKSFSTPKRRTPRRSGATPKAKSNAVTYKTIADAVNGIAGTVGPKTHAATYVYNDETGAPVFAVARFNDIIDPEEKAYRPLHLSDAGWVIGDPPDALPLYRLDKLARAGDSLFFVTEGEKAADAAANIGLHVTTSSHGSASAAKTDWSPLAGYDVVILPDNDTPGEKYADAVTAILMRLDPPAKVKHLHLPDLPDGGDIVEFLALPETKESSDVRAGIVAMADVLPWLDPSDYIGGPVVTCLADVDPQPVTWLWPGRIASGKMTALIGAPGGGKSFVTIDIAARITTGTPWPDGSQCPAGSVIICNAEDDLADTIRPRLDAHHADVTKVHCIESVKLVGEDGEFTQACLNLSHIAHIETVLSALQDCRAIIIDPVGSFLGGKVDSHRDNEVRSVLAPLAQMAAKYKVAVILVMHTRKGVGGDADERALGSRAFIGIVRGAIHLIRDPDNPSRRLFLPGKNNIAPEGGGLAFTIAGEEMNAAVVWDREPVMMTANEALQQFEDDSDDDRKPGPEPAVRIAAEDWLRVLLKDAAMPVEKLKEEVKAAGHSWSTIRRAGDSIGVIKERCEFSKAWQWRMPKPGTIAAGDGIDTDAIIGNDQRRRESDPSDVEQVAQHFDDVA